MQLTRFDRWLREKFVYQTQIHTLRPLESLPSGVRAVKKSNIIGLRYKHLYVANKAKAADALVAKLKESGHMYTTQVVDRKRWYVPIIAPKAKSLTWWIMSMLLSLVLVLLVLLSLNTLLSNPEMKKNLLESLDILREVKVKK